MLVVILLSLWKTLCTLMDNLIGHTETYRSSTLRGTTECALEANQCSAVSDILRVSRNDSLAKAGHDLFGIHVVRRALKSWQSIRAN